MLDQRVEHFQIGAGGHFEHVGGISGYRGGTGKIRYPRSGMLQKLGQFDVRIVGHDQPCVGTRRQSESVLNALNGLFLRLAGTPLQIAEAHRADAGGRRQFRERPVPGLAQSPDCRARRLPAHCRVSAIAESYTVNGSYTFMCMF